jgi:hypothetical protein
VPVALPKRSLEPAEDLAITLVRRFLLLCESPRTRRTMLRMVRGSTGNARAGRRFYRVVNRAVLSPVIRTRGVQTSAMKTELVASQLIGIGVLRYVVKVEPMASATVDEVIELAAPSIRATLRA